LSANLELRVVCACRYSLNVVREVAVARAVITLIARYANERHCTATRGCHGGIDRDHYVIRRPEAIRTQGDRDARLNDIQRCRGRRIRSAQVRVDSAILVAIPA